MFPNNVISLPQLARASGVLPAHSISRPIREYLRIPRTGTVLATFRRSCYVDLEGRIIALVAADLLNGPLNIVLEVPADRAFQAVRVGGVAAATSAGLTIDGPTICVSLQTARTWSSAVSPWTRIQEGLLHRNLALARALLLADAPKDSMAHLLPGATPAPASDLDVALQSTAGRALAALAEGIRRHDRLALTKSGHLLAGLGSGLTPSGDDVLVGALLALAASPPVDAATMRATLKDASSGRSTRISEAYLDAAARGEASEPWHHLLAVLPDGTPAAITSAVRAVIAVGETSGADMLAGFLLAHDAMRSAS